MMARLHPRVVLRLHHVAVGASGWVIGEIGVSLGVDESAGAEAEDEAQHDCQQDSHTLRALHHMPLRIDPGVTGEYSKVSAMVQWTNLVSPETKVQFRNNAHAAPRRLPIDTIFW